MVEAIDSTTFVSAFFDIRSRENNPLNGTTHDEFAPPDYYLNVGRKLLKTPINLVFFTESKYVDYIAGQRKKYGLFDKTRIITLDFEQLPIYDTLPRLEEYDKEYHVSNLHPEKFTPLYYLITHCKTHFINRVSVENPFNSHFISWIDFRLLSASRCSFDGLKRIASEVQRFYTLDGPKVWINMMSYVRKDEVSNRYWYYRNTYGKVAGGFIIGERSAITQFHQLCHTEYMKCLDERVACVEEMLYGMVLGSNYPLFHVFFGDYCETLSGSLRLIKHMDRCSAALQAAYDEGNHHIVTTLSDLLYISHEDNLITLPYIDLYKCLLYGYAGYFYLKKHNKARDKLLTLMLSADENNDLKQHMKSIKSFLVDYVSHIYDDEVNKWFTEL
jgi:hypothetical protein